jgi:hypothetical protein
LLRRHRLVDPAGILQRIAERGPRPGVAGRQLERADVAADRLGGAPGGAQLGAERDPAGDVAGGAAEVRLEPLRRQRRVVRRRGQRGSRIGTPVAASIW